MNCANNCLVATTIEEANVFVSRMRQARTVLFGFDTETTTSRTEDTGKVSVVQLCNGSKTYIFQVYRMWKNEGSFPPLLTGFLSNASMIKVGVAADNDAKLLELHYGITCRGVIDIQYIATSMGITALNMDDLAAQFCPIFRKMGKGNVFTDWDRDLDDKHIQYAHNDALLSLMIYQGIFTGAIVNDGNDAAIEPQDDHKDLLAWVLSTGKLPTKNTESLANAIANSYSKWAKIFTMEERMRHSTEFVERMIQDGKIVSVGGKLFDPADTTLIPISRKSIAHDDEYGAMALIANQFGHRRKYDSLINQLVNGLKILSSFPMEDRREYAAKILAMIVEEGRLIEKNGYYYLV